MVPGNQYELSKIRGNAGGESEMEDRDGEG